MRYATMPNYIRSKIKKILRLAFAKQFVNKSLFNRAKFKY